MTFAASAIPPATNTAAAIAAASTTTLRTIVFSPLMGRKQRCPRTHLL